MLTELQLEMRSNLIGGTDSSKVVNMHPYSNALDLYLEKTGQKAAPDLSDNEKVLFGNILEPVVAQEYSRRTGLKVRRVNRTLIHKEHSFIGANIDRDIPGTDRGLEIKTASEFFKFDAEQWGESGTDEVPMQYHFQCNHYMAVTGKKAWDLAVLMGGNELRIYTIERNDVLIKNLIEAEVDFWCNHVLKRVPPPLDFAHTRAIDTIKHLYPGTNGMTVMLSDRALEVHQRMSQAKAEIKELEKKVSAYKNELLNEIGENAVGQFPDGTCYKRKLQRREGYTVEPFEFIDFRFSKKA